MNKNIAITALGNVAEMRITGRIGEWDMSDFRSDLLYYTRQGITNIDVYINSIGGDAVAANEIVNEMKKFSGNIRGFGGAIVASAATYIACNCDTFEMASNGQFMIHKPSTSVNGNEDEIKSRLKLIENTTKDYVKIYSKKTKKPIEEIEQLIKSDFWMSAEEALSLGFIDSVSELSAVISAEMVEDLKAYGCPLEKLQNLKIEEVNKNKTMNIDFKLLGLTKSATEEEVNLAIKKLTDELKNAESSKINALIDSAIAEKKINSAQKDSYIALANADFEHTKAILEGMVVIVPISAQIEQRQGQHQKEESLDRKDWNFSDWLEKDYPELLAMSESNVEKYNALVSEHLGKK